MARAPSRLVALVDASAFYVSCERVFAPGLEGRPVAVLSNNDGCVIARSQEVKDAGIRMGEPFFKARERLEALDARVFSSNYTLYGDMSRRVMDTLHTLTPDVAPYSIDEAFLSLPCPTGPPEGVRDEMEALARRIRSRVRQWTGIPVRVSIAETKTLAKAASEYARAQLATGAEPTVCFVGHPDRAAWLERLPVGDVWGVGRRWSRRLTEMGAPTAGAFARLDDAVIRRHLSVVGLRTAMELRGVACVSLHDAPAPRHTLIRSRSFGERITDRATIERAVATHAARAAEKLRREGLVAGRIGAFVTTKGYGDGPHRSGWTERALDVASARTPDLIRAALLSLRLAHVQADATGRPYGYRKAGVVLSEMRPAGAEQTSLFAPPQAQDPAWQAAQSDLMATVDRLNRRFGTRTVVFGAMGTPAALRRTRDGTAQAPRWEMRREHMTPRYTTRWDELACVRA